MSAEYDVVIVGGGPAGLSAALLLGRCRRKVLICDANEPRNAATQQVHGFLTRDGIPPPELRRIAREQALAYPTVTFREIEVSDISREGKGFRVALADQSTTTCRKILLATGLRDELPPIDNVRQFYGVSVHHCPLCDAWDHRDQSIAAYGCDDDAIGVALELRVWSDQVTLCTNGTALDENPREKLRRGGVAVIERPIVRLFGSEGRLEQIHFASGPPLNCQALFFCSPHQQRSHLPEKLGCLFNESNEAECSADDPPCAGVFTAGNVDVGTQLAIVAAAEGAMAAQKINDELATEDFG